MCDDWFNVFFGVCMGIVLFCLLIVLSQPKQFIPLYEVNMIATLSELDMIDADFVCRDSGYCIVNHFGDLYRFDCDTNDRRVCFKYSN